MTAFKILATLAFLVSFKVVRLGLLVATWLVCRQSYINLSLVTIGQKICYLTKEILRPAGLEPMEDFCAVSLIWSSTIIGLTTAGYIFSCTWIYLKEELRSFWIELQDVSKSLNDYITCVYKQLHTCDHDRTFNFYFTCSYPFVQEIPMRHRP
ncbi:hypothetical protein PGTUg99_025400 [Puccinia graminis f. sp. tritici]|uniref:Uncharacterized protein n=1 Tax=Puccinia graminis f. sp. tritici TaxID=56615 RepID=A0A5B0PL65_PUCGR|nr:hypothetical protein PGTUg99_025400 [Puccinia graminis f. sp. tritici]